MFVRESASFNRTNEPERRRPAISFKTRSRTDGTGSRSDGVRTPGFRTYQVVNGLAVDDSRGA